jgi:hypothetical protein
MSVASKLLGTPSHEEMAQVRQDAQIKASEDAQRIRELEKQLREAEGETGNRGRALADAHARIRELEATLEAADQHNSQREWQMEQHRERARQMLQLATEATQASQSEAIRLGASPLVKLGGPGAGLRGIQVGGGVTDIRSLPQNAPEQQP